MRLQMRLLIALAALLASFHSFACDIQYRVNVKTVGEKVTVELRKGIPGKSRLIKSEVTRGGLLEFNNICPGSYFIAVGDGQYVDVTPQKTFEEGYEYESELRYERVGNVKRKKRTEL